MKVVLEASPFDLLPPELLEGFRKAVASAAITWGLPVEIVKGDSVQQAVIRFHERVLEKDKLASESRG